MFGSLLEPCVGTIVDNSWLYRIFVDNGKEVVILSPRKGDDFVTAPLLTSVTSRPMMITSSF